MIPGSTFIAPNMIEGDVTLTETTDTGIAMDIQKGDMIQFTIPSSSHTKAFKFKAFEKESKTEVQLNGLNELIIDPSDAVLLTAIVVHKPGNNSIFYFHCILLMNYHFCLEII